MNALDEVLKAEQEAEQVIKASEEKAVLLIQKAETDQQTHLDSEERRLEDFAKSTLSSDEIRVAELAKKIMVEAETKVSIIEKNFAGKKEDLKTKVKQRFQ